jgi:hypothetical protein
MQNCGSTKIHFLILLYWVHYTYVAKGFALVASDTQIVAKGKYESNTAESSLSGVVILIYNKLCT